MQEDLNLRRQKVDQIDEQLVKLLNTRATVALEMGKLKAQIGAKAYDPVRERAVLDHIDALNRGPLSKGDVEEIFGSIITACREIQSR